MRSAESSSAEHLLRLGSQSLPPPPPVDNTDAGKKKKKKRRGAREISSPSPPPLPQHCSCLTRVSRPISSRDGAVAQSSESNSDSVEGPPSLDGAAMDVRSLSGDAAATPETMASPPFDLSRLFSAAEKEKSPHSSRMFTEDTVDGVPTPRAPMKPSRSRSLNAFFPGKTRRRLDFDHL